ncbi:MAG: hypothetical protein ABII08_05675 [Candidatus Beckwithbacteria bacterium]|nr:hypothetical protein [Patescibacteria group bacterium]
MELKVAEAVAVVAGVVDATAVAREHVEDVLAIVVEFFLQKILPQLENN